MTAPIYSTLPERINAGQTVKYTKHFADYPPTDGWAITLYIAGPGVDSWNGSANGVMWDFHLVAADTAVLPTGLYRWEERATKSGEIYVADQGYFYIDPNLATATGVTLQDPLEKELAQVEAALDDLLSNKVQSYQVGDRTVSKLDIRWLLKRKAELRRAIKAQQFPGKLLPVVQANMVRPQ